MRRAAAALTTLVASVALPLSSSTSPAAAECDCCTARTCTSDEQNDPPDYMCKTFAEATDAFIGNLTNVTIKDSGSLGTTTASGGVSWDGMADGSNDWVCPDAWISDPSLIGPPPWPTSPWGSNPCPWSDNATACADLPPTFANASSISWECQVSFTVDTLLETCAFAPFDAVTGAGDCRTTTSFLPGDEVDTYVLKAACDGQTPTAITTGDQYAIGITGPCAWRKGDFVHMADVPERFLAEYMTSGASSCPTVNTQGGGSVFIVFLVIVIVPIGAVVVWAILYYFGPKMLPCSRHHTSSSSDPAAAGADGAAGGGGAAVDGSAI
eukprot:SAG22_NODE_4511_length_1247_cov_2.299652_1_plen_324_part_10